MKYTINYGQCTTGINTDAVGKHYNGKYIGDFCIRTKSGAWGEDPVSVFYQENPPDPSYSNYFGIFVRFGVVYITNAASAFEEPIIGAVTSDGEVIYSRFRHDFRQAGSFFVDGGRDYFRCGGAVLPRQVTLVIDKDKLVVQENDDEEVRE